MQPIVLPLERRRYWFAHLLRDDSGTDWYFHPSPDDIPTGIHLYLDDPLFRIREIACTYRAAAAGPDETIEIPGGVIVVHDLTGRIARVRPDAAANRPSYDQAADLLDAFHSLARSQASTLARPLEMLFSAEVLNDFWQKEEETIRRLLSPAPS